MNEWRPMAATNGVVRYTSFSMKHGLGTQRHRGFIGRIWKRTIDAKGRPHDLIEGCGHAHKTRRTAEACAKSWAKRRNKLEAEASTP